MTTIDWGHPGFVFVNLVEAFTGIDTTGGSDAGAAVNAALVGVGSSQASGQIAVLPAGTYEMNTAPSVPGGVRLLVSSEAQFTGTYAAAWYLYTAAGSGFAPASSVAAMLNPYSLLSGAAAWWDAGSSYAGVAVPDQTGNGWTLTSVGIDPTVVTGQQGGRTCLRFAGTEALKIGSGALTIPSSFPGPFTVWAVAKNTPSGANQFLVTLQGGNFGLDNSGAGGLGCYFDGWTASGGTATTPKSVAAAFSTDYNAGAIVGQFRANGVVVQSVGFTPPGDYNSGSFVGASSAAGANSLVGDVYELAIWNSLLTPLQLAGLDAYAAAKYQIAATTNLLVMDGNSFVSGSGASGSGYYLGQQVLGLLGTTFGSTYVNNGVSGEDTGPMNTYALAYTDPLATAGARPLCVAVGVEGTNDIYHGATVAQAYADMVTYCQARRAAGFKVITTTILSRSNAGTPAGFNTMRAQYNAMIRSTWPTFADGLADWASDPRMGPNGAESNSTYFSGDDVHPSNVGYAILAGYVAAAIKALPGS